MRLIDADVLLEYVQKRHKENYLYYNMSEYYEGLCDAYYAVLNFILKQQTIEERKHGHWTKDNKCSECGAQRPTQGINKWIYLDAKYCYACGTKMDEVTK